jgi:beta-lactam-binding protein with PASTA domain
MDIKSLFKSSQFWRHFALASLVVFTILGISIVFLNVYTKHGDEVVVPNFEGIYVKDLDKFIDDHDVQYEIVDSIYNIEKAKGTVADQDPEPGSKVKPERVIYLTVFAMLNQKTAMPNLVDLSLRQASSLLETYGLKVGKLRYEEGLPPVMKQLFKGKAIKPGTMIDKGSKIDLVLGKGLEEGLINVPNLTGLTLLEVREILSENQLILKNIYPDEMDDDTLNARVYRQNPPFDKEEGLYPGAEVRIWITNQDEKVQQEIMNIENMYNIDDIE